MLSWLIFRIIIAISLALAAAVFTILFFIPAPYGRHARKGWGPQIPGWLGWLLMEGVSALTMLVMFLLDGAPRTLTLIIFLLMWEAHYIHRAFIYPFTRRGKEKPIPAVVVLMGTVFNLGNAYLNGHYIYNLGGAHYPVRWLVSAQFIVGTVLFLAGFVINRQADNTLRQLRGKGETGYRIPYGGLYRYISCPNYFGEIVEWTGWAIATWSWPGLAFALWTIANLAPRGRSHHKWYREHFKDYPKERRALVPLLW